MCWTRGGISFTVGGCLMQWGQIDYPIATLYEWVKKTNVDSAGSSRVFIHSQKAFQSCIVEYRTRQKALSASRTCLPVSSAARLWIRLCRRIWPSIYKLTPCLRQRSETGVPAYCSFNIPTICSSVSASSITSRSAARSIYRPSSATIAASS